MAIVILVVFVAIIAISHSSAKKKKRRQALVDSFSKIPNFTVRAIRVCESKLCAIAFDESANRLAFSELIGDDVECGISVFEANDILQVELVEDGETVSSASAGSAVARAVVGGILTGGIGMIIGGVTGKRNQRSSVRALDLKCLVNDAGRATRTISFLPTKEVVTRGDMAYKAAAEDAEKWYGSVSVLIHRGKQPIAQT